MAIQRLPSIESLSDADQIPVGPAALGVDAKIPASLLKQYVQDGFVPSGGLMALSSIYAIRISTPRVVAVGAGYANVANWESGLVIPSESTSLVEMLAAGEFVATRDIAAVQFWVGLTGTYPTTRDLTVAVLVGTDATPFESAFRYVGAGRGAGAPVTANLSGIASNLNNPFGTIKAGEKVRLVLKMSVADNLSLDRLSFAVQTLDGR